MRYIIIDTVVEGLHVRLYETRLYVVVEKDAVSEGHGSHRMQQHLHRPICSSSVKPCTHFYSSLKPVSVAPPMRCFDTASAIREFGGWLSPSPHVASRQIGRRRRPALSSHVKKAVATFDSHFPTQDCVRNSKSQWPTLPLPTPPTAVTPPSPNRRAIKLPSLLSPQA